VLNGESIPFDQTCIEGSNLARTDNSDVNASLALAVSSFIDRRFTCHYVMSSRRYHEISVITGELRRVLAIQVPRVGSLAGRVVVETFERDR